MVEPTPSADRCCHGYGRGPSSGHPASFSDGQFRTHWIGYHLRAVHNVGVERSRHFFRRERERDGERRTRPRLYRAHPHRICSSGNFARAAFVARRRSRRLR